MSLIYFCFYLQKKGDIPLPAAQAAKGFIRMVLQLFIIIATKFCLINYEKGGLAHNNI